METIMMIFALMQQFFTGAPVPTTNTTPVEQASTMTIQEPEFTKETTEYVERRPMTVNKNQGQYGEVTTIVGTGTEGESTYMLDHPKYPVPDSKGNIFFLDGTQETAKLRKVSNGKASTLITMSKDPVASRDGLFYKTGVAVIKDKVYFSSEEKVYQYVDGRATVLDEKIQAWMKSNQYEYVYRMKAYKDELVIMLCKKNITYGFIKYNPSTRVITKILDPMEYPSASNFFIQDRGISVSSTSGFIYYEKFSPRQSITHVDTNEGPILDAFIDKDEVMYCVLGGKRHSTIYSLALGSDDRALVAGGSGVGFQDGIADQVLMDQPQDFMWDGSGYLFADTNNNAIRKLWVDVPPLP